MKNFDIEYSNKKFKKELLENVIITYDDKKFNFFLKRNHENNMCIIGDDEFKEIVKNFMDYVNPGTGFLSSMMFPMFTPLQVKINLDKIKVSEVYIKNNKVDNGLIDDLELSDNLNIKYLIDPIANLDKLEEIESI